MKAGFGGQWEDHRPEERVRENESSEYKLRSESSSGGRRDECVAAREINVSWVLYLERGGNVEIL